MGKFLKKMLREQRHVFTAIAQRWDFDWKSAKPVVQIFAKLSLSHQTQKMRVGGGHDAGVDPNYLAAAETLDFSLLEKSQQFWL